MGKHGKARARESAKNIRLAKNRNALSRAKIVKSIRKWDDPILKEVCEPVEISEMAQIRELVDLMIKTLKATKDGVGLAAPQLGVKKNVIVFRTSLNSNDFSVFINPLLVKNGVNSVTSIEGCLSYPGYTAEVKRYDTVEVTWKDIYGNDKRQWLDGRSAIIFQHENDHLQGICAVQKVWEIATGRRQPDDVVQDSNFFSENTGSVVPSI